MKFNKLTRSDRRCLSGQISPTLLPSHLGWPWLNYLISQEISAESSKWNPSLWLTRREAREFLSWNIDPPIIFPNKAGLPLCGVASVYFEVSARVLFLWLSDTVRPIIQVAGVREKELDGGNTFIVKKLLLHTSKHEQHQHISVITGWFFGDPMLGLYIVSVISVI